MLYDPFAILDRELTRLGSMVPARALSAWEAPTDVRREGDRYVVEMDVPGVDPSSIDVTLEDGWLSVKADRSSSRETRDGGWVVRERNHSAVVRRFAVDESIDADAIRADYGNGVLTLTLPLAEQARPRRISLTTGTRARELGAGTDAKTATVQATPVDGTAAQHRTADRTSDEGKAEAAHLVAS